MSIPEVDSKNRLLEFLSRHLKKLLGNLDLRGNVNVGGNLDVTGNADVGGNIKLGSVKSIQDSDGSNRITLNTTNTSILNIAGTETKLSIGESSVNVTDTLKVFGFGQIDALRVGTSALNPSDGNLYVEGLTTLAGQPMVYAFRNSTQTLSPTTDWNTVIFNDDSTTNDTAFDVGTDYATGTGIFTAPADGKYLIAAEVMLTNTNTTDGNIMLKCITTNSAADGINQYAGRVNPDTFATEPDYVQIPGTWLASMDSGDTAYVQVRNTSADSNTKIYGATTNAYTRIQIMKVA
tara:strand:+ start:121 stop:996 length:876 start_codon:yes stop_codon:yes gene_type:complete